jgi:hypothetical protein
VVDPKAGADGGGAGRIAFRLVAPTAEQKDTYCALVDRTPRDLSGRQGITLKVKGDRVYRISFQVRDENPASADEGTEWWFASIRTAPEWRTVVIPFSRFRSINPKIVAR